MRDRRTLFLSLPDVCYSWVYTVHGCHMLQKGQPTQAGRVQLSSPPPLPHIAFPVQLFYLYGPFPVFFLEQDQENKRRRKIYVNYHYIFIIYKSVQFQFAAKKKNVFLIFMQPLDFMQPHLQRSSLVRHFFSNLHNITRKHHISSQNYLIEI